MKNAVGGVVFATILTLTLGSVLTGNDGYLRGQSNPTPTPRSPLGTHQQVGAGGGGVGLGANGTVPSNTREGASAGVIAFSKSLADGQEQLILVDPHTRVLSVYHIESATGKTALKSVRRLEWDQQLNAFNTQDPQPLDVRTMVAPR